MSVLMQRAPPLPNLSADTKYPGLYRPSSRDAWSPVSGGHNMKCGSISCGYNKDGDAYQDHRRCCSSKFARYGGGDRFKEVGTSRATAALADCQPAMMPTSRAPSTPRSPASQRSMVRRSSSAAALKLFPRSPFLPPNCEAVGPIQAAAKWENTLRHASAGAGAYHRSRSADCSGLLGSVQDSLRRASRERIEGCRKLDGQSMDAMSQAMSSRPHSSRVRCIHGAECRDRQHQCCGDVVNDAPMYCENVHWNADWKHSPKGHTGNHSTEPCLGSRCFFSTSPRARKEDACRSSKPFVAGSQWSNVVAAGRADNSVRNCDRPVKSVIRESFPGNTHLQRHSVNRSWNTRSARPDHSRTEARRSDDGDINPWTSFPSATHPAFGKVTDPRTYVDLEGCSLPLAPSMYSSELCRPPVTPMSIWEASWPKCAQFVRGERCVSPPRRLPAWEVRHAHEQSRGITQHNGDWYPRNAVEGKPLGDWEMLPLWARRGFLCEEDWLRSLCSKEI